MSDGFRKRYGPWCVVAGASEGLGEAFARALAGRGLNIVLVARRAHKLEDLARQMRADHGIEVRVLAADLSQPSTPRHIMSVVTDLDVGLLVYNAAASSIGSFLSEPAEVHEQIIRVNVASATDMCHGFGSRMAGRRRGGIILMTSLSAFQGSPLIATYAATKAFLLSLAEALSFELRDSGVDVLACAAGATRTPGYLASMPRKDASFRPTEMEPADVVAEAMSALGRKSVVIPGRRNRLSHLVLT
ncbi:MAG: SDR family NAD(P)-dependent oxidoreductase, partial [Rhodothermales bacterium]|nr:SDR family NAD(P)-dependent oxidoreductase [Rhodothermales bacterium]